MRGHLLTLLSLLATASAAGVQCGSSNVSCPLGSQCVPAPLGYKWACNLSSGGRAALCYPGAPHPLSSTKKNVLVIGDSVSNGYFLECGSAGPCVPALLADIALVQHAPWSPGSGGAGNTQHGLDCLDVWLKLCNGDPAVYDLISFNFGLHDLDNTTTAVGSYTTQLAALTDKLLATGSKLQYHLTTPMMPQCCLGSPLLPAGEGAPKPHCSANDTSNFYPCDQVVQELNSHAQQLMAARGIPVVDLYGAVTQVCGARYSSCSICRKSPCSYHYTAEGYVELAKLIAASMRRLLSSP